MSLSKEKNSTAKKDSLKDGSVIRLLITFFLGFLVCCVCFLSMTWAWFTDASSTGATTITAGKCMVYAEIINDSNMEKRTINAQDKYGNPLELLLDAGTYTVEINRPENTASGYLTIKHGENTYYSAPLRSIDSPDQTKTISFTLKLLSTETLTFEVHWGIYSSDDISVIGEEGLTVGTASTS